MKRVFKTLQLIALSFLLGSLWGSSYIRAQKPDAESYTFFTQKEDTLLKLADSMYTALLPEERVQYCFTFIQMLNNTLKEDNSFYYPFSRLQKRVHIIYPEDKSFRIFNWLILPQENVGVRYFGAVQIADAGYKLFPLISPYKSIPQKEQNKVLSGKEWLGAEYYKLKTVVSGSQKHYFLFGINQSDFTSTYKMLEEIKISEDGITLGSPAFQVPATIVNAPDGEPINRFILEYKKGTQVALNYEEERSMVIFDRLASDANTPSRRGTYVATGAIDGLEWKNGQWNYIPEIIKAMHLSDGQAPINGVMK